MKTSLIDDAGFGLFADRKIEVGDIVSVYLGSPSAEVIDGQVHTLINESPYKIKITLPVSKEVMQLEVVGGGFPRNKVMYLGAHMFNDPLMAVPEDERDVRDEAVYNVKIAHDLTLVAEKVISIGHEIYGCYNFDRK